VSTARVNDNLIQITRWRFVNAFLVREEDGFTLVDTTVGGGADELIGSLEVSNHFHLRFPLASMATRDKGKALDSAGKLRELDPAVLVVGHGGPVRSPGPAMDKAIANAG
jgi:hypothetical protein